MNGTAHFVIVNVKEREGEKERKEKSLDGGEDD